MVIEILRSPEFLDWPAVDTHVRDASAGIVVLLLRGAALVIEWSSSAVVIDNFLWFFYVPRDSSLAVTLPCF
jgi:hypothetical protein